MGSKRTISDIHEEDITDTSHLEEEEESSALLCSFGNEVSDMSQKGQAAELLRRFEELEAVVADLTNELCEIKAENRELKNELSTMKSFMVKKDFEIEQLRSKVTDHTARSMGHNVLLHNIPEAEGENCEQLIRQFLTQDGKMKDQDAKSIHFERVHRMGAKKNVGGEARPRIIVAKVSFFKDKELILEAWKRYTTRRTASLPRSQNTPFVSNHLPPEIISERSLNWHTLKTQTGGNPQGVKVVGPTLFYKGGRVRPPVAKPSASEILSPDKDVLERARKLPKASHSADNGWTARVFRITSVGDVRAAFLAVMTDPFSCQASHNTLGYCLKGTAGWQDDGDFGAGRFITSFIERKKEDNIAIIITRNSELDRRIDRFNVLKDIMTRAMASLGE